jgi:16S rRNA G527 N7-methylase RsmG
VKEERTGPELTCPKQKKAFLTQRATQLHVQLRTLEQVLADLTAQYNVRTSRAFENVMRSATRCAHPYRLPTTASPEKPRGEDSGRI